MHEPFPRLLTLAIGVILVVSDVGCQRKDYREDADNDAYGVISERGRDPRWKLDDFSIEIDPRSRFYDRYDPDHPPMPRDDPSSQRYMHSVDGMEGWASWLRNGVRDEIENPAWREALAEYVEVAEDGSVRLDVDSALRLVYLHSPFHQQQLETLFLSALDVTRERFRFETQFFGGYGAHYSHTDVDSRLVVGSETGANPAFGARRLFAYGGELIAGFANSFVFELTSDDPAFSPTNFSASLVNFALVQPLLRGAGKDVTLERLTLAERNLLGNVRSYAQFRQGFYTQVVIGEIGVDGPQRAGPRVNVNVFRGDNFVGGFLGLLLQLQRIRNTEDNLDLQLRTLAQLEANLEAGLIDLVQVDQFRQSVEFERANLLIDRNQLANSLDSYKTGTLGLAPDLPVDLDDGPIRKFQLVSREASAIQDEIAALQANVGDLPPDPSGDVITPVFEKVRAVIERMALHFELVRQDLEVMDGVAEDREVVMTETEVAEFRSDRAKLQERLARVVELFDEQRDRAQEIEGQIQAGEREVAVRGMVNLLSRLLRVVQGSILVQARARLEAITVESIELSSGDAFRIALTNRLDFMNARSALVDSWRSIQVTADRLRSRLDLTANGELRTSGDKAGDFKSPHHSVQLGVELDSPFSRLVERNDYRESLINYQRSRRAFIQSRDSLHLGLRSLLRSIEQLRMTLEIQRRAVVIAIRRVDLTRAELYSPVRPPEPGQRPAQFGPTAAINLLSALSSLRDTQNSFLSVWLNYYAARLRLYRELGIMKLDPDGRWAETTISASDLLQEAEERTAAESTLPPAIPKTWIDSAEEEAESTNETASEGDE